MKSQGRGEGDSVSQPDLRSGPLSLLPFSIGHTNRPGPGCEYKRRGSLGSSWELSTPGSHTERAPNETSAVSSLHTRKLLSRSRAVVNGKSVLPAAGAEPSETSLTPVFPAHPCTILQQILVALPSEWVRLLATTRHLHRNSPPGLRHLGC